MLSNCYQTCRQMQHQEFVQMNQMQFIKFYHQDLSIYNWQSITDQLNQRFGTNKTIQQCKQIYLNHHPPTPSKQWTLQQQMELYKLHDKFGNKWSTISSYLIGRTDNCVKNKIYAKLRKSLRALNKIVKVCYKKQLKEISSTVLYKLTEVGEEKLKIEPGVESGLISRGQDLKNTLLTYEIKEDVKKGNNYETERALIKELLYFNKRYRKKTKKEKTEDSSYNQNIRKALDKKQQIYKKKTRKPSFQVKIEEQDYKQNPNTDFPLNNPNNYFPFNQDKGKKLLNVFIKAPTVKEEDQFKKSSIPQNNGIQDILKTCGILQNGEEQVPLLKRQNSLKGLSRRSSFSNVSQSSFDMFGEDFGMPLNNELSEMEGDSDIFQRSQQ